MLFRSDDVNWVIPHEANLRIIEAVTKRAGIPLDKVVVNIDHYGNTSAKQAQEFFKELGISKLIYPEMLAAVDINNGLKMSWVRQRWDVHDGALVMLGIKLREGCEILNEPPDCSRGRSLSKR